MWGRWDVSNLCSRTKRFLIWGGIAFGSATVMVGAYMGMHWWLSLSLSVLVRIEQSLPSWLVPTVAIALGLIAALLMVRPVLSQETSRWRWLAIVPFWALQAIFWLGGVMLGLLLSLPLLPLFMWDEKQKAEVAKKQLMTYQKSQELRNRARSEYMAAIRQKMADEHAADKKWREEAPLRAEQTRLRRLERSRARRMAEKEAERIRQADKAMKDRLFAEIYRSEGFSPQASRTQEVRLRVVSPETKVAPPPITLPVGDYPGYAEFKDFNVEGIQNLKLVMLFLDEATVGKLELNEQPRPIKFEVLNHIRSGAIQFVEG
jgi:hypothetical protein